MSHECSLLEAEERNPYVNFWTFWAISERSWANSQHAIETWKVICGVQPSWQKGYVVFSHASRLRKGSADHLEISIESLVVNLISLLTSAILFVELVYKYLFILN